MQRVASASSPARSASTAAEASRPTSAPSIRQPPGHAVAAKLEVSGYHARLAQEFGQREHDVGALGSEGADAAEWVLVDFDSVVLHVMQPPIREFYDLERLWERRGRDAEEESAH